MNYQEKIEEAYGYAEVITDKYIRKSVMDALNDGEVLASNEEQWRDLHALDIVDDLIDQLTE